MGIPASLCPETISLVIIAGKKIEGIQPNTRTGKDRIYGGDGKEKDEFVEAGRAQVCSHPPRNRRCVVLSGIPPDHEAIPP